MIYGYFIKVPTDKHHSLQLNALKEAGAECIYKEYDFYKKERPQFEVLMKGIKYRDTFIIWKLSRIGYSFKDMMYKVRTLLETGVHIKSIKEDINIPTGQGKLMLETLTTILNFNHSIQSENTLAGLRTALSKGRTGGRPKSIKSKTPEVERIVESLEHIKEKALLAAKFQEYDQSLPLNVILSKLKISQYNYHKYLKK